MSPAAGNGNASVELRKEMMKGREEEEKRRIAEEKFSNSDSTKCGLTGRVARRPSISNYDGQSPELLSRKDYTFIKKNIVISLSGPRRGYIQPSNRRELSNSQSLF